MARLPDHLSDHLREHLREPRHVGEPPGGAARRGEARNPACGDIVVLWLALGSSAGSGAPALGGVPGGDGAPPVVTAAGFKAQGCPAAMATASLACDLLPGLPADASLPDAFTRRLEERFGPTPALQRHALALVTDAIRAGLAAPRPDLRKESP